MPAMYEAILRYLLKKGKSKKEAQRIAAATYNKRRKKGSPPVGPGRHGS